MNFNFEDYDFAEESDDLRYDWQPCAHCGIEFRVEGDGKRYCDEKCKRAAANKRNYQRSREARVIALREKRAAIKGETR